MSTPTSATRSRLMAGHVVARQQRDSAPLGSEEYRLACEEIARIEVAIATAEEPVPQAPAPGVAATASAALAATPA